MKVAGLNMAKESSEVEKAVPQAANDLTRPKKITLREVDKAIMGLKREIKLMRRNSTIARPLQHMRDNGASEQSIQRALPGLNEFAKVISRSDGPPTPKDPENPPAPDYEEILGMLLS